MFDTPLSIRMTSLVILSDNSAQLLILCAVNFLIEYRHLVLLLTLLSRATCSKSTEVNLCDPGADLKSGHLAKVYSTDLHLNEGAVPLRPTALPSPR